MIEQKTGLTICRVLCVAPQIPCLLPRGRCRCGMCPPRPRALLWLLITLPPGHFHSPQKMRMTHLHLSSSCSFSPHHPSTGPNTGWGTHEHPNKHWDMHQLKCEKYMNRLFCISPCFKNLHWHIKYITHVWNTVGLNLLCAVCFIRQSYILHVSRETLSSGGNGTLYFPQKVLLCLWTTNILLGQKVSKTSRSSEDITK